MKTAESVAMRRRLRVELRRARLNAELTQKDIADRLAWSPSKIIRIESGQVAVSIPDLRALLMEYGVRDEQLTRDLEELARGSKRQPWSEFRGALTPATIQLYGFEAVASRVRTFELILIPGLLQTEEYARAVLRDTFRAPDDRAERIVEARLERQELLDQPDAPRMDFLIDEAAIRRVVGGPKTMEAQLRRISQLAKHPRITVQIIPFPVGAHPGMQGPITHMEFPDPDDDVVYVEGPHDADAVFRDDPAVTANYLQTLVDLEGIACRPDEVDEYLGRAIEKLP